jgi:signal transduction histidine kinase/CheY-like chemotaxis protein
MIRLNQTAVDRAFLSTAPAEPHEQRLAIGIALASFLGFVATVPFVRLPLPQVWAFIPSYESALALTDLITAALLLGQFARLHSRALLALACGYLFSAFMAVPHALTFPGLFSPTGLLGAGPQTTAWLYMFWHGGFPLSVIAYALLKQADGRTIWHAQRVRLAGACGVLAVAVVVGCLTLLATEGVGALPSIMAGNGYTPAMKLVVSAVWALSILALIALWWKRPHSVLDLWLMIVMCAWLFDIALSAVLNAGRFDLGFYAGRIYGLLAASFVLIALLFEIDTLYARLARSLRVAQERNEALQATTTELAQSQDQLRQAQKMEAIGQLTGGVAHDFNNLLTAVIVCLDMFDHGTQLTAPQRDLLRAAQRSAARGARLTRQLLAFGRRQTLQPQTADINQLLKDFDTLLHRAVGETVELVVRADPDIWPCAVDHGQFEAALLNLALNARDAMPGGGTLTIATSRIERRPGDVRPGDDWKAGDYVAVAVSDTGVGMSAYVRERAFEPFFTTKGVGKGSGLGLSQVYGFVKQMGGHVTIESADGKGTTVTLYVPRASAAAMAATATAAAKPGIAASAPPATAPASETVLVVEDDDDVRDSVIATLGGLGYQVLTASNGSEAIALLRTDQHIDLLFTDVVMPRGANGVEVAREAQRLRRGIKILLTSGYTPEILAQQGANGNFPVFIKPYRPQDLVQEVRRIMRSGAG